MRRRGEGVLAGLRRGLLALVVLCSLAEAGEMHGYALRKRIAALTGWEPAETTLYDVLKRLEREGLAESYWAAASGSGALRKYYRITEEGRRAAAEAAGELARLARLASCGGGGGGR